MPTLERELDQQDAKKRAKASQSKEQEERQSRRVNPEIEAKLNAFIEQNKELHQYYLNLPKEDLARRQMLRQMERAEFVQQRNKPILDWVEKHPDIKAAIQEQLKNVPERRKASRFITLATQAAAKVGIGGGEENKPKAAVRVR